MTCTKWHRLGERCECGHLTVPARFYGELTHEKAEEAYLAYLEQANPELWGKLVTKSVTKPPVTKLGVTKGRPKKHGSSAEKQAAYRQRKGA